MESQIIESTHILRLDPGEEIVTSLIDYCEEQGIQSGLVTAIGAVNDVTIGLFDPDTKEYASERKKGNFEIVALTGNIATKDGEVYAHLHIGFGDDQHAMYGGHLNQAFVSATCEIYLLALKDKVERFYSSEIGLNLLKLK